jgi:ribulose-phosphate 3-epimerase
MRQKILPSIMAKNQKELNQDFKKLNGVVKHLHLDIVDGKFAKSKVMFFPFKLSKNFNYSAHLMIKNPEKWIKKNHKKIELLIPQFEELKDFDNYLTFCKENKKKVAIAIKPETKIKQIKNYLNKIDYVLVLTVHPGFYGANFLPKQLKKIKQIKKINPKTKVIIDGGMNPKTIKKAKKADHFVSGSYTTKSDNPKQRIKSLLQSIN